MGTDTKQQLIQNGGPAVCLPCCTLSAMHAHPPAFQFLGPSDTSIQYINSLPLPRCIFFFYISTLCFFYTAALYLFYTATICLFYVTYSSSALQIYASSILQVYTSCIYKPLLCCVFLFYISPLCFYTAGLCLLYREYMFL